MLAADSIESMVRSYKNQGGVYPGLWSILISRTADQSADFARRHFDSFNNVVGSGWHLVVFAESKYDGSKRTWNGSESLHTLVEEIRRDLVTKKIQVPELSALFFDPNAGSFNRNSLIIPFDPIRIGSHDLYKKGFEITHSCIMEAFNENGLDPYQKIPVDRVDDMIAVADKKIRRSGIKSQLSKVGSVIGNAGLGAMLGTIPGFF